MRGVYSSRIITIVIIIIIFVVLSDYSSPSLRRAHGAPVVSLTSPPQQRQPTAVQISISIIPGPAPYPPLPTTSTIRFLEGVRDVLIIFYPVVVVTRHVNGVQIENNSTIRGAAGTPLDNIIWFVCSRGGVIFICLFFGKKKTILSRAFAHVLRSIIIISTRHARYSQLCIIILQNRGLFIEHKARSFPQSIIYCVFDKIPLFSVV